MTKRPSVKAAKAAGPKTRNRTPSIGRATTKSKPAGKKAVRTKATRTKTTHAKTTRANTTRVKAGRPKAAREMAARAKGTPAAPRVAGVSDEAVVKATGKDWSAWCRLLDKRGAPRMSHKEIAILLHDEAGLSAWWSQMVTVGYEQARGRREPHQRTGGFSASRSMTFSVPIETLFAAWSEARARGRWLGDAVTIRTSTTNRSMRILWADGASRVEVTFTKKGPAKSQVSVQHEKLGSQKDVAAMKALWGDRLARLKEALES